MNGTAEEITDLIARQQGFDEVVISRMATIYLDIARGLPEDKEAARTSVIYVKNLTIKNFFNDVKTFSKFQFDTCTFELDEFRIQMTSEINFINCIFNTDLKISTKNISSINFTLCHFNADINLHLYSEANATIKDCYIKNDETRNFNFVQMKNVKIHSLRGKCILDAKDIKGMDLYLINCDLRVRNSFKQAIKIKVKKGYFLDAIFDQVTFDNDAIFEESDFNNLRFNNCSFIDYTSFRYSTFISA